MKKLSLLSALVLALAGAASAQIEGMGWDNQTEEAVGRLGISTYGHLELGIGFRHDGNLPDDTDAQEDARTSFSLSVRYLHALHAWERLTGYLHAGLYFREDNNVNESPNRPFNTGDADDEGIAFLLGYEPEVQLIPHLAVSTRFGLAVPIAPEVGIGLVGDGVSIVSGFNFRVLF